MQFIHKRNSSEPEVPDEYERRDDGGEELVQQVDSRVGEQQAQFIHHLQRKGGH